MKESRTVSVEQRYGRIITKAILGGTARHHNELIELCGTFIDWHPCTLENINVEYVLSVKDIVFMWVISGPKLTMLLF